MVERSEAKGGIIAAPIITTAEILFRLEVLWRKLEDDGMYVQANTVALAIVEINRLGK